MSADPVAVAALVVSVATFLYAWLYNRQQDRRWDALNQPRFAIRDIELATWREISRDEHANLTYGYANPIVTVSPGDPGGLGGERLRVPVGVVAYRKNSDLVTGTIGITVAEVRDKIIARGHDLSNYFFVKYYMLNFALENVGASPAVGLAVVAKVRQGAEEVGRAEELNRGNTLPGEKAYTVVRWATPLEQNFPVSLTASIEITFRDVLGAAHHVESRFAYDITVGAFRRSA